MNRLLLATTLVFMVLCHSSCSYINAKKELENCKKRVNLLQAENTKIKKQLDDYSSELAKIKQEKKALADSLMVFTSRPARASGGNFAYHVIIGSFKKPSNAESYANKVAELGYDAQIIDGPGGFLLVSAAGYNNFRDAKSAANTLRQNVTPNTWIYDRN